MSGTVVPDDYELEFAEEFDGDELDGSRWLPYHLPQWSTRARSAARYRIVDGCLHLRIEPDQGPWCPEFDGATRVSSLQTGVFSGPVGSTVGQHRFNPDAEVREAWEAQRLYTPRHGAFVLRARADIDGDSMVALWMIGFEDAPERSGEICICEIFGSEASGDEALVGMGVHPFGDPRLVDDFEKVPVAIDVADFHEYGAVWRPDRVDFFVDGHLRKTVRQAPDYPMQFMLGIYDFAPPPHPAGAAPKQFVVDWFRSYRGPADR